MRHLFLCALLLVAACHKNEPPAPTAEEADELNQAGDMLNELAQNEEGPEANASGPSNSSD